MTIKNKAKYLLILSFVIKKIDYFASDAIERGFTSSGILL